MKSAKASRRGQLSIEYLLLTAAILASLAVLVPKVLESSEKAEFAIDFERMKEYCTGLEKKAVLFGMLENSSAEKMRAFAKNSWTINAGNGELKCRIESESLARVQEFDAGRAEKLADFEQSFQGSKTLEIRKENGKVLVVDSQPDAELVQ